MVLMNTLKLEEVRDRGYQEKGWWNKRLKNKDKKKMKSEKYYEYRE